MALALERIALTAAEGEEENSEGYRQRLAFLRGSKPIKGILEMKERKPWVL